MSAPIIRIVTEDGRKVGELPTNNSGIDTIQFNHPKVDSGSQSGNSKSSKISESEIIDLSIKKNQSLDSEYMKSNHERLGLSITSVSVEPSKCDWHVEDARRRFRSDLELPVHLRPKRNDYDLHVDSRRRSAFSHKNNLGNRYTVPLQTLYEKFREEELCSAFLLTFNILAWEADQEGAWKLAKYQEEKLIALLAKQSDILYAIVAIEEHPPPKKKPERKRVNPPKNKKPLKPEDRTGSKYIPNQTEDSRGSYFIKDNTPEAGEVVDPDQSDKDSGELSESKFAYVHEYEKYEDIVSEVIRVFYERRHDLSVGEALENGTAVGRMLDYLRDHTALISDQKLVENILSIHMILSNNKNSNVLKDQIFKFMKEEQTYFKYAYGLLSRNGFLKKPQKTLTSNLTGYPHLHVAVVCRSTKVKWDKNMFRTLIYKSGLFNDQDVARRGKPRPEDDLYIHNYVFKSIFHEGAYRKLGRNTVTFYNISQKHSVNNLMSTYVYTMPVDLGKYIDNVPEASLFQRTDAPEPRIIGDGYISIPNQPRYSINKDVKENSRAWLLQRVKRCMEENQIYIEQHDNSELNNKVILHQKIPGSASSFRYWGKPSRIFNIINTVSDPEILACIVSYKNQVIEGMCMEGQNYFPGVIMDYSWVEFGDFFLHIPTGMVVLHQDVYPCFAYFPDIKYSDIQKIEDGELLPNNWLNILTNSGYFVGSDPTLRGMELLNGLYSLLVKSSHKTKCLVLHGESNAGKTSLFEPLLRLYPESKIALLGDAGSFSLSMIPGSLIAVFNEFDPRTCNLSMEQVLGISEMDTRIAVNRKHKDMASFKNDTNIAITCNDLQWARKRNSYQDDPLGLQPVDRLLDPALSVRMNFVKMKTMENVNATARNAMINVEVPIILLYLVLFKHKQLNLVDKVSDIREVVASTARTCYAI